MASYSDFVNRNKKIQKKDREKNTEPYLRRDTILKGLALGRFYLPGNELKPEAENNQKLSNIEAGSWRYYIFRGRINWSRFWYQNSFWNRDVFW